MEFLTIKLKNLQLKEYYSMKKKIITFLFISWAFILLFPIIKKELFEKNCSIQIIAEGTKNDSSKGTEVWLDSIEIDGNLYNLDNLSLTRGWENKGRIFSSGDSDPLEFELDYTKSVKITFIKHPYSGNVLLDVNGKQEELDLYSMNEETVVYKIDK